MDIYSGKFWRLVAIILLFDLFFVELTFHRGEQVAISPKNWDFRIQELRQIEATPRVRALNGEIQITKSRAQGAFQSDWLSLYFPGQVVPLTPSEVWRLRLSPYQSSPTDQSGKVL